MGGLLRTVAGFVPGVGQLTALANPTVLAILGAAVILSYCTGERKGTQRMKAVCVAAAEKAKAEAEAVDRSALEAQIADERKTNADLQAAAEKSRQEIEAYEKQQQNDTCRITDDDVAGGL